MNTIQEMLEGVIAEQMASGKLSPEQLENALANLPEKVITSVAQVVLRGLKKRAPEMLNDRRGELEAFRLRHFNRWRMGLDRLRMLSVICEEAGSEFNSEFGGSGGVLFEAMGTLHVRAMLVMNEILCLLEGGFADGALGRWRALHELSVVALFIAEHGERIAERYLASFDVQAFRAMQQYQTHQERAALEPFSKRAQKKLTARRNETVKRFGPEIENDYGWAAAVLGNPRPTFSDIERHVGLDHWRPRYKWASGHTHAQHKPFPTMLGMGGVVQNVMIVGP